MRYLPCDSTGCGIGAAVAGAVAGAGAVAVESPCCWFPPAGGWLITASCPSVACGFRDEHAQLDTLAILTYL